MKTATDLATKFWQARLSQDKDLALALFAEAKRKFGLAPQAHFWTLLNAESANSDILDLCACEISVLRLQKRLQDSQTLLRAVEARQEPADLRINFFFQFEVGLTEFVQGQWAEAQEHFKLAKKYARESDQAAAAQLNILLCLENLALATDSAADELAQLIPALQGAVAQGLLSQWRAYQLREGWRRGFCKTLPVTSERGLTQDAYLQSYLQSLPYFATPDKPLAPSLSALDGQQFNQNFRVLTLLGQNLSASGIVRLSDWIERLYLWTWRWVANPEQQPLGDVLDCLKPIQGEILAQWKTLATDDQMTFLLAVRWLCKWDPLAQMRLQELWSMRPRHCQNQTWALEWQTQEDLFTTKIADPAKSSGLKDVAPKLQSYFSSLVGHLKNSDPEFQATAPISIDTLRSTVTIAGVRTVQSPIFTRALIQLSQSPSIEISDFAKDVFGLQSYDAFLHYNKISNLLSRLNSLLPKDLRIFQREGRIALRGDSTKIELRHFNPISQSLQRNPTWQTFQDQMRSQVNLATASASDLQTVILQLQTTGVFTRRDLQNNLQVSKSQAQRILENLRAEKRVSRQGHSRSVQYHITNPRRAL